VTAPGLDRREEASRRTFDRWAAAFDRSRLLRTTRAHALHDLALTPGDRFLDVACGGGRLVLAAAPHVTRAAGIDLSPGMLDRARTRAAASANVDLHLGSAQRLPFADGEFTVVACTAALHHFPDPAAAVAEVERVLAPGGRFLLADVCTDALPMRGVDALLRRFERGHVGFRPAAGLERLVAEAGLTVVRARHRLLRTYALVLARKGEAGG
jgi:ubiquinone/menaquinone biosynthesis C-methylase UbiE